MAGAGESVAAHASVVFFFIGSLSVRCQPYDDFTRANIGIVNDIGTFHAACYGRIYDDGTNQVTYISSLASGSVYAYTHFAKFGQQFIRSVDDSGNDFTRNE